MEGSTNPPPSSSTSRGGSENNPLDRHKLQDKEKQLDEALPVTKLKFSGEQLEALNYHLSRDGRGDEDDDKDFSSTQAASIVERLTQRLLCAVGNLDPRFASKFLICLTDGVSNEDRSTLEYIVRLDALSTPVLYPKDALPSYEILEFDSEGVSPGFARIRLRNKTSTNWAEFINSSGFLRRDKIQERFVELLALAAAGSWPVSPLDVDDSTLCAAPGKIVDAATAHHVLHVPAEQHVFYGPASSCLRFPDPRDFRLAIVDEPAGIRLRVGFLAPGLAGHDVEVRLLVALGVDAWPRTTDFPQRVEVGHADCLLYHEAALTGMYLTALGQHSASWQIQVPAAEVTLLHHYGPTSAVKQVLKILYQVLDEVHSRVTEDKCKFHCKLLTRRLLRESLYSALESSASSPLALMAAWTTGQVARHVVRTLDRVVGALRDQHLPGYFFPGENLLGNPGHAREEDYLVEANRLYMYMVRLHSLPALPSTPSHSTFLSATQLDASLAARWRDVVTATAPATATRSCRFSSLTKDATGSCTAHTQYTARQLQYVGQLLKRVLDVKQNIVQLPSNNTPPLTLPEDPTEDIIYLLVTIIEQARDHVFTDKPLPTSLPPSTSTLSGKPRKPAGKKREKYKTGTKAKAHFDSATVKLVDHVRKEKKKSRGDVEEWGDMALVKSVLRYLYKAIDHSRHTLAPVLRPYLTRLFVSSHELSWTWYLDQVHRKEALEELHALGMFARVVNRGEGSPAAGLVESVNKGWTWASTILSLVSASPLRVVFVPSRGKVLRHILSLPSYSQSSNPAPMPRTTEDRGKKNATLPARRAGGGSMEMRNGDTVPRGPRQGLNPTHQDLKVSSPMTETFSKSHRLGKHRCAGDLVQALTALNKISILHELSHILQPEDRRHLLSNVQRLCREHKRQAAVRRRATMPPSSRKTSAAARQVYTPTEDGCHGHQVDEGELAQRAGKRGNRGGDDWVEKDSLIGSCRAARIKEDSRVIFHENFKIKALFKTENT